MPTFPDSHDLTLTFKKMSLVMYLRDRSREEERKWEKDREAGGKGGRWGGRKKERESAWLTDWFYLHLVHSPMPQTAEAELKPGPRNWIQVSTDMTETKCLNHHGCCPGFELTERCSEQPEPSIESSCYSMRYGHLIWHLNTSITACLDLTLF